MFVAGNFLSALAVVLHWLLQAYMWVVIIRVLLSWVNPDPRNPIVQTLNRLTDPLLDPIRRKLYRLMGYGGVGIDLSPLVLIAAIWFVDYFVVATLHDLDVRLH
jgi:YggT family protein